MRLDSQKELTPIIYGEFPVKVLHITALTGELAFSLHWHDRLELHCITAGSLELFCGDEQITLHAGDVAVISPQLLHHGVAGAEGVTYDVVMFELSPLLNHTAAAQWIQDIAAGETVFEIKTQHPLVATAVEQIVRDSTAGNIHSLEMVGQLYALLGVLYRFVGLKEQTPPLVEKRFAEVIAYINERYAENISSSTLSARFGYDEAYFCRKFKRTTGVTVMRYIRTLRLERARVLLMETQQPIHGVALACGFSDAAYFTNCFKQQYGVTASELRSGSAKKRR